MSAAILAIIGAVIAAVSAFFAGRRIERGSADRGRARALEAAAKDEADAERRDEERELELRLGVRRIEKETRNRAENPSPTTADVDRIRAEIAARRERQ